VWVWVGVCVGMWVGGGGSFNVSTRVV